MKKPAARFQLSIDESPKSGHASLDQALEALKEITVPRFSTGYVDALDTAGKIERTIYTKEGSAIKRVDA